MRYADNLRLKQDDDRSKQRALIYSNLKPNNKCHYTAVTLLKIFAKQTNPKSTSITVQTDIHLSPKLLLTLLYLNSKLMKEEISKSVGEAGIYLVQIDSAQDITSTDKCSVILRFIGENIEKRILAVVDSHPASGADLCNLLKEVLWKQNIDVSKCIFDSTDGASNMSRQHNRITAFLEKESPGQINI